MYHPTILELRVKERERELMNLIKNEQMIREIKRAKPEKPRFRERICIRFAEFLISTGSKIKQRYRPIIYPCAETMEK